MQPFALSYNLFWYMDIKISTIIVYFVVLGLKVKPYILDVICLCL